MFRVGRNASGGVEARPHARSTKRAMGGVPPGRSLYPRLAKSEATPAHGLKPMLRRRPAPETLKGASRRHASATRGGKEISMKRNGFIVVCVFAGAVLLIGSCAKPYHTQNERYVFVATNIDLPYWQEARA